MYRWRIFKFKKIKFKYNTRFNNRWFWFNKKIELLNNFPKEKKIYKDNQDETDIEYAIRIIISKYNSLKEIDMIYCISNDRIDHLLGNNLILKKFQIQLNQK